MDYFKITKKDNGIFIHFFNRGWSIYWSKSKPNLLKEIGISPVDLLEDNSSYFTLGLITSILPYLN